MARIADNLCLVAEICMKGIVAAGGSNNRPFEAVFNFKRASGVPVIQEGNIESAFQTFVALPILAALNNRLTQTSNVVRLVNDAERQPFPTTRSTLGLVAGDSMKMDASLFILFRTATRGRFAKGGKKFFPLSESDTTAGTSDVLNAGSLALWATAVTAMGTPFVDSNGNTWSLQIRSKKLPSQERVNPTTIITYPVNQILVNKRIGKNKKRQVVSQY